jgi:hypothetical protein
MAEKIKISDLFDFSDVQDLQELYRRLEQINQIYKELAKNINQESQTINKGIEANVKEVKKLSEALKVAGDSADIKKLSDQIEKQAEINKKLTAQNEKLISTNAKLKASQKEVNDEGKEAERLLKEQSKLKAKISAATGEEAKQNAILRLELQRINKETKEQVKQSAGLENAYQKLVRETREAKNEAKRLGAELGTTSTAFLKAQKNASKLDQELKDLDGSVGDFQRNVGNYESALDGIGQGFSGILELATPVGAAIAVVGLAVEGIGALAETVQETNNQLKETAQLTGLTGDELTAYTSQIRATSKVFDQEYKEVLRASNIVAKEFGITGAEAIDLINNGFVQGTNINDDYLQQLSEYSTQFKAAGLSAQDLNNVIALGAKEGIFDDKAADTVKEGGLRLREFTKATSDALLPLGKLRNEQIKQAIESGKSFEAIQLVSKGLKEVNLTAQQSQTIIADVFGGAGEDAGLRFIERLSTIKTGQDAINANLTEQQKKQLQILKVEQELSDAEVRLGEAFKSSGSEISIFFKQIQTLGIEGIISIVDDVKDGFGELAPLFGEVGGVIDDLAESLGLTGSGFIDFIKRFNPVTRFIEQAVLTFKFLLNAIKFVIDILRTSIDVYVEVAKAVLNFGKRFEVVKNIIEGVKNVFKELLDFFTQAPKFLTGLTNAFIETFNQIAKVFRGTFKSIRDGLEGIFNRDFAKVREAIAGQGKLYVDAGKKIADAYKKGFDETKPIETAVKNDTENAKKVLDKSQKEIAAKTAEQNKKESEKLKKALEEKTKLIDDAAKEEKLKATKKRNDDLSTEQEYQDDLLIIELGRLEKLKEAQEKAGVSTVETEKQIQDILLNEKKKGEKLGLEQEKKATKESERITKESLATKTKDINKSIDEEKLLLSKQLNDGIITQQDIDKKLIELELQKQQQLIKVKKQAGENTIKEEQRIQDLLLQLAAKEKEERAKLASDPVVQAGFDAIEGKIKNELVAAGVSAFRSSLEKGDDVQTALANGTKAVAAGQVFKSLSQGFHDGGYTGEGYEYGVAGVVHKGEHVITKDQTNKYGLKGLTAGDFDKAVETGYFNQFVDVNNATADKLNVNKNIVVNNNNTEVVNKLDQLITNLPKEQLKEVGGVIQHIERRGQITKTTNYPLTKRTVR